MEEDAKKELEEMIQISDVSNGILRACILAGGSLKLTAARVLLDDENDGFGPTCDDLVYVIEHVPELRKEAAEIFFKYYCVRKSHNCEHPEHYVTIAKYAPEYKNDLKNNFKSSFFHSMKWIILYGGISKREIDLYLQNLLELPESKTN